MLRDTCIALTASLDHPIDVQSKCLDHASAALPLLQQQLMHHHP
jgi:hypothetical protein|tara:strand:- start:1808 stop:1939 length:132 start_codon:yes stop_codon:yes gene_type:complete